MTTREALHYVASRADDYVRLAKLTGAGIYPLDNKCGRCGQVSGRPLVPWSIGWCCDGCSYGPDGHLHAVVTQPPDAACCSGGPLLLRCQLCRHSPTYWRTRRDLHP